MTCSPACWIRYGDLLAVQYASPRRMAFHQLVVDTYAVQHPDSDDPRAIKSVGIHLMVRHEVACVEWARRWRSATMT